MLTITKAQRKHLREHLSNLVRYEMEDARNYRAEAKRHDSPGLIVHARKSEAEARSFRLALRAVLALPVEEGKKR